MDVIQFQSKNLIKERPIFYKIWIFSIFIVILILVFFPTFSNEFQLGWDDTWQVLQNPFVHSPSVESVIYHFTHFWQGQYSPVNSLFYFFINEFFGLNAFSFHTACLIVHYFNCLLVFFIVFDVLNKVKIGLGSTRILYYSFFTTLIFSIHPVQVESVAWISASKILLYGFFTLLGLFFYIRYISSNRIYWLVLVCLCYYLGFGSKEQAIIFPANLILIDFIYGRFKKNNYKKEYVVCFFIEKIPFIIMFFLFFIFMFSNLGGVSEDSSFPFYQRIIFGFYSFIEYVFRFLVPSKFYFLNPFPITPGDSLPFYFYGYLLLTIIVCFYIFINIKKSKYIVLYGFLFFLLNLILVLHIFPLPRTIVTADRYMYLSVIGASLILIWQIDQIIVSRSLKFSYFFSIVFLFWIIFLSIQTFNRTIEWYNTETIKASVFEIVDKGQKKNDSSIFNLIEG